MTRAEVWGSPISHSLSPTLHRAAYAWLGLPYEYAVREVDASSWSRTWAARGTDLLGLSVTMPLKQLAATAAQRRSEVVELLGVANTLVPGGAGVAAHNTDATALQRLLAGTGGDVLIVGGGATAASALWALSGLGVDTVRVATRSGPRPVLATAARALGVALRERPWGEDTGSDTIVLALPAAARDAYLAAHRLPSPPGGVVMDVAYPGGAAARRLLEERGWRVRDGRELLVEQAREQVRLMTGGVVPASVLAAALAPEDVPGEQPDGAQEVADR